MAEKTIEIDVEVNSKDAVKGVDKLGKSTDKLGKSTDNVTKSTDGLSGGMSTLGGSFGAVVSGAQAAGKALLALALNPIGAVIAALAVGIIAVKTAFESSEEGQNKYAKLMGVIGAITGNFMDLLADLGETIIEAFENPREALESFANVLKDNIINRFEGMVELIPQLGKAINELFKGNFTEAGEIAANAVGKVALGVDDLSGKIVSATEATKEFIKEQEREGKLAAKVEDDRAKANKIERDLIVRRSELESKIAQLRLKSRQEDQFSASERRQALIDAQELENELLNRETQVLELRRDAQILENTFSRSNIENLDKEATAIAAVNNQVTKRANVARQLQRELNTIQGQIDSETKGKESIAKKKTDKEAAAKKKELDDSIKLSESKAEAEKKATEDSIKSEIESIQRGLELKRDLKLRLAEEGLDDPNITPEQIRERAEAVREARAEIREVDLAEIEANFEDNLISQEEKDALVLQANMNKSNSLIQINKKEADSFKIVEDSKNSVRQHSINAAVNGLKSLSKLDEDNKALQAASLIASNAVGIAKTIQSTVIANAAAVAASPLTAGQPFVAINTIAAGAGIASSIKETATGLKALGKGGSAGVKPSLGGGGGGGGGGSASAPSINEETLFSTQNLQGQETENIGENAGINQIKAIVVESDITNAQNKINDIETSSEIG